MMDHLARLLVARTTYYLGWLTAILAALMQVAKIATVQSASPRNVLEASFLLFVICMASGVRAVAPHDNRRPRQTEAGWGDGAGSWNAPARG